MLRREESRHDLAFVAGVMVGAVCGALATLALTPFSGAEAREKLRERTGDLATVKERAAAVASTAREKVEPVRERALDLAARTPLPVGHLSSEETETPAEPVMRAGASSVDGAVAE